VPQKKIRRKLLLLTLSGAATAWPLATLAQQQAMPVIGFLGSRASGEDPQLLTSFRLGLKEAGYVEGQNVVIDYRFAENQYDRLPALAADLVQRQVVLIAANGPAAQAAKSAWLVQGWHVRRWHQMQATQPGTPVRSARSTANCTLLRPASLPSTCTSKSRYMPKFTIVTSQN
jgi:hypothetical protein